MKALWSHELQAILQRGEFLSWWQSMLDLRKRLDSIRAGYDELLTQVNLLDFKAEYTQKNAIDELYRAGEWEDTAAQLLAEASEIENKSYEAVANFENQRILVSDLFSKIGAVEHNLLDVQAEIQKIKAALSAEKTREQREEIKKTLKKKEAEIVRLGKELQETAAVYERGKNRKLSLWEEVEQMWARSLDISLRVSERRIKSKRIRGKTEFLFKEAEKYRLDAEEFRKQAEETGQERQELEQALYESRQSVKKLFGCLVGEDFLYWPCRKGNKEVFCVPIQDQPVGYNIELRAKNIYLIDRQTGVEFVRPLPPSEEHGEEEDDRLSTFFAHGKGRKA